MIRLAKILKYTPMNKELSKSFNPSDIEKKWYEFWESKGYYKLGEDLNNPHSFSIISIQS